MSKTLEAEAQHNFLGNQREESPTGNLKSLVGEILYKGFWAKSEFFQ
ncbi:MAG: hypothetical protein AB1403_09620 [Candidatus Riflebacteria bacterium]